MVLLVDVVVVVRGTVQLTFDSLQSGILAICSEVELVSSGIHGRVTRKAQKSDIRDP